MRKKSNKPGWIILGILLFGAGGAWGYFIWVAPSEQTTTSEAELQTARVRQGDITLSATGTGKLVPATEASYAFDTSGRVAEVYVSVGDIVKAGQVLAILDDTAAQKQYETAQRTLLELTSDKAIAKAHQAVNAAEAALDEPRATLVWMLSPTLFYCEERLEDAQQTLADVQDAAGSDPSPEEQAKIKEAEVNVKLAQYNLVDAQAYYEDYRLIKWGETETFGRGRDRWIEYVTITDHTGETYYVINGPTNQEIAIARAEYAVAKANLLEVQWYYDALLGKELPAEANSAKLVSLEQAHADLESATQSLSDTQLITPISGMVTTLNFSVGDKVNASTSVITISDVDNPYIDLYLDETDWELIHVGNSVEVTFDALPDQAFRGTVVSVDPGLYSTGGVSLVHGLAKLDPLPENLNLPFGLSAVANIIGAQVTGVVLTPIEALTEDANGIYSVYVLENDQPVRRAVEIGLQDQLYAQVISGLQVGDVVVTGNLPQE